MQRGVWVFMARVSLLLLLLASVVDFARLACACSGFRHWGFKLLDCCVSISFAARELEALWCSELFADLECSTSAC